AAGERSVRRLEGERFPTPKAARRAATLATSASSPDYSRANVRRRGAKASVVVETQVQTNTSTTQKAFAWQTIPQDSLFCSPSSLISAWLRRLISSTAALTEARCCSPRSIGGYD